MLSVDFRAARRAIGRLPRPLLLAAYMVLSVSGIFLLMEGALAVGERLTNDRRLLTVAARASLADRDYPARVLRMATFGGSAATGFNAESSFSQILELELSKRYPEVPVRVTNLAMNGYPFYRHQAELLKSVIDDYDIFLVYAGNNEGWNYWDDVGFFRKEEFKDQRVFKTAFNRARWFLVRATLSAYPQEDFVKAEEYIQRYYSKSNKAPKEKATFFLVRVRPESRMEYHWHRSSRARTS